MFSGKLRIRQSDAVERYKSRAFKASHSGMRALSINSKDDHCLNYQLTEDDIRKVERR